MREDSVQCLFSMSMSDVYLLLFDYLFSQTNPTKILGFSYSFNISAGNLYGINVT